MKAFPVRIYVEHKLMPSVSQVFLANDQVAWPVDDKRLATLFYYRFYLPPENWKVEKHVTGTPTPFGCLSLA